MAGILKMTTATIAATMTKIAEPKALAEGAEFFDGIFVGVVAVLT